MMKFINEFYPLLIAILFVALVYVYCNYESKTKNSNGR
jgi:hypothetical protein